MEESKIRWRKVGGGTHVMRINGKKKRIKEGQTFFAAPSEIPQSFRDIIKPVDGGELEVEEKKVDAVVAAAEKPVYTLVHTGGGWYDIVDQDGKKVNESGLRKDKAQEMLSGLGG